MDEIHVNIEKCGWYKEELKNIVSKLKKLDIIKPVIISQGDTICLKIAHVDKLAFDDFQNLENDYKEMKNYFLLDGDLYLKFEKNDPIIETIETNDKDSKVIQFIVDTSKLIEVTHTWNNELGCTGSTLNFEFSNHQKFIDDLRIVIRKMNIYDTKTKIDIKVWDSEGMCIIIENLVGNVQLKRLFLEMELLSQKYEFEEIDPKEIILTKNKNIKAAIRNNKKMEVLLNNVMVTKDKRDGKVIKRRKIFNN